MLASIGALMGARQLRYDANYANDRSMIEDLQSRYMVALDWQDAEACAATLGSKAINASNTNTENTKELI